MNPAPNWKVDRVRRPSNLIHKLSSSTSPALKYSVLSRSLLRMGWGGGADKCGASHVLSREAGIRFSLSSGSRDRAVPGRLCGHPATSFPGLPGCRTVCPGGWWWGYWRQWGGEMTRAATYARAHRGRTMKEWGGWQDIANDLNLGQTKRQMEGSIWNHLFREKKDTRTDFTDIYKVTCPRSHNSQTIDILLHILPPQNPLVFNSGWWDLRGRNENVASGRKRR